MVPGYSKFTKHSRLGLIAVASLVWVSSNPVWAAQQTWTGVTNSTWSTNTNWSAAAPTNSLTTDTALFDSTTYLNQPNAGTTSIAGIVVGDGTTATGTLTISGTILSIGASGITINPNSGVVTISAATTKIGASQTWTNNSSSHFTVTSALTNFGTTPFTLTIGGSGTGGTTLGGVISNNGAGTIALIVNTTGGVTTLSGANTFTGGLDIQQGTVVVNVSNATTISGAAGPSTTAITLGDAAGGSASLLANSFTVSNAINLGSSSIGTLTIGNNGGATAAVFSGPVALNGNNLTISSLGTGSTTLSGGITGTGTLTISNATTRATTVISTNPVNNSGAIINNGAGTGTTTINGGVGSNVTSITEASTTSALTISANAITVNSGGTTLTKGTGTKKLTVTGGVNGTGNLVLNNNSTTNNGIIFNTNSVNNAGTITNSGIGTGTTTITGGVGTNVTGLTENSTTSALTISTGALTVNSVATTLTNSSGIKKLTVSSAVTGTGNLILKNNSATALAITLSGSVNNIGTITNSGTGTGSSTITSVIGPNVTGVIQNSTTSQLTLSGANTFTGGVTLTAGQINLNNASALGGAAGTFTINGGAFDDTIGTLSLTNPNPQAWNGSFAFNGTQTLTFGTGAITLGAANITVSNNGAKILTENGAISGTSNLTFNDKAAGGITLSGTVNNAGTITNSGTGTGSTTIGAGGVGSNVTGLTENSTTSALTVSGSVTVNSGGTTLTNSSGTKALTITGGVTGSGNLVLNNNSVTTAGLILSTGSINNAGTIINSGTGAGSASIKSNVGPNVTAITQNSATSGLTLSGSVTVNSGGTTLTSGIGATALTLSGSINGVGNLLLKNNGATASGVALTAGTVNNSGTIINSGTGVGSALITATIGPNVTGVVQNSATSALILSGVNSFTSGTTVNAGTVIGTTGSALGTNSNLTVASGATFAYQPTVAGTLSIGAGILSLANGSTIGAAISGTASQSVISSASAASVTGTITVTIYAIPGGSLTIGSNNLIIAASGLNGATYTLGTIFNLSNATVSGLTSTGTSVSVTVVPLTVLGSEFWKGGFTGLPNVWAASNGSTSSNWATTQSGTTITSLTPGSTTVITFSATAPSNESNMVLGANMTVGGIVVNDTTPVTLNADGNTLTLSGTGITVNSGAAAATFNAPVVLGAAQTWTNNASNLLTVGGAVSNAGFLLTTTGTGNITISGAINGGGGVTMAGTGTLVLSGANTYTGTTTVSTGTVRAGSTQAFGINTDVTMANVASAKLDLAGNNNSIGSLTGGGATGGNVTLGVGTLTISGTNSPAAYAGTISGSGGVTQLGTGTTTFSGTNTYSGVTNLNGGTLAINSSVNLGNASATNQIGFNGGTLDVTTAGFDLGANRAITLNGAGTIQTDSGTLTISGSVTNPGSLLTVQGAGNTTISGILSGDGDLTKAGTGTLILSGTNTYDGNTNINAGTLRAGSTQAFGINTDVTMSNVASAKLDLAGISNSIGSLTGGGVTGGNITLGTATLTIGSDNASPGAYAGIISGSGGITEIGTGTLTLSGSNTYTGVTTLMGGTLALVTAGTNNLATSSNIIVGDNENDTGAVLDVSGVTGSGGFKTQSGQNFGGHGTVTGALITVQSGSTFTPGGNGSIGTLTLNNGLTINSGSTTTIELGDPGADNNDPGNSDQAAVTGNLKLGGTLSLVDNAGANGDGNAGPGAYLLFTYTGTSSGSFSAINNYLPAIHGLLVDGGAGTGAGQGITLDEFRLASATVTPTTIALGNYHVGLSGTQTLTVTNTATNDGFSESLDASGAVTSGNATVSGTVNLLGAQNSSTNVSVGLTGLAGPQSGQVTVTLNSDGSGTSGFGTTLVGTQTINVSGTGYRLASATTSQPVTLTNIHAGGSFANMALTVSNSATADGFSEGLNGTFTGTSGAATTGGAAITNLAAGGNSTNLIVGLSGSGLVAGNYTGTATLGLTSNGAIDGLGNTPLSSQTINITGKAYRLAAASAYTPTGTLAYGNVHQNATVATQSLTFQNTAANDGFSESLDGTFGSTSSGITTSGSFSLLAAQSSSSALTVGINTSTVGSVTGTATINLTSDGTGTSGLGNTALPSQIVNLTGFIYSGQGVWNTNGNGNWSDFTKWTANGGAPGLDSNFTTTDTATFSGAATSVNPTVSLNGVSPSLNGITFNNSTQSYTVAQGSGGSIKLNNGASEAPVNVIAGNHTISAPVELDSNASFSSASGASLTVSGSISESGGARALALRGLGPVLITGNNTYSGGTTVASGTLFANNTSGSGTGSGNVTVNNGATLSGSGIIAPTNSNAITAATGSKLVPGGVQTTVPYLGTPGTTANGSLTVDTTHITLGSTIISLSGSSPTPSANAGLTFTLGAGGVMSGSQVIITGGVANTLAFNVGGGGGNVVTIDDLVGTNLTLGQEYDLIQGNNTTYTGLVTGATSSYGTLIVGGLSLLQPSGGTNFFSDYYVGSALFIKGDNIELEVVPEPGTWALLLGGLLLLAIFQRRRSRKRPLQNSRF